MKLIAIALTLSLYIAPVAHATKPIPSKNKQGAPVVTEATPHVLTKMLSASRSEIIAEAKKIAEEKLTPIDLSDFSEISVERKKREFQITFASKFQVPLGGNHLGTSFFVNVSERGIRVSPDNRKSLFTPTAEQKKILSLFSAHDSVMIIPRDDHWQVTASRRNGGGSEGYRIDKKTFEKKMTWHEHPQRTSIDNGEIDWLGPKDSDPWVEVTE